MVLPHAGDSAPDLSAGTHSAGETSALGRDYASLIGNIPVRHFTTIFRPQFWGFFLLPPAYGFSFYWQFKAMLLASGVFSLLFLLSRSSRIALFGTLWYFWSANTQWTYSWPSLLPEMIGAFCLTICSVFYISTGRRSDTIDRVGVSLCDLRDKFRPLRLHPPPDSAGVARDFPVDLVDVGKAEHDLGPRARRCTRSWRWSSWS